MLNMKVFKIGFHSLPQRRRLA